jgi:hypothetical protein
VKRPLAAAIVLALCAASPGAVALAQEPRLEDALERLKSPDPRVRRLAAFDIGRLDRSAEPAVPALLAGLADPDKDAGEAMVWALSRIGDAALPGLREGLSAPEPVVRLRAAMALYNNVPSDAASHAALVRALSDPDPLTRSYASGALARGGDNLKRRGEVRWWVIPLAYWQELLGLALAVVAWFGLAARFNRRRPLARWRRGLLVLVTAAPPFAFLAWALVRALRPPWVAGFLPGSVTLLPFREAAILTLGFACALAATWAAWGPTAPEDALP